MSQLDTYRKTVTRKREELAKLSADLSKEQAKISPLQKKILLAKNAIGRTKSQTTINSKMREIEQSNKSLADICIWPPFTADEAVFHGQSGPCYAAGGR